MNTAESAPIPAESDIVTFGKYKGRTVGEMLNDSSYCAWLLSQPWFAEKQPGLHRAATHGGAEPQDSPEHNEMQARFLDEDHRRALVNLVFPGWSDAVVDSQWAKNYWTHKEPLEEVGEATEMGAPRMEVLGWDVNFDASRRTEPWQHVQISLWVELKPDLGDDFPSVLRQVERYMQRIGYRSFLSSESKSRRVVVVVRRARFSTVTWDQVKTMFANSNIVLVKEEDMLLPAPREVASREPDATAIGSVELETGGTVQAIAEGNTLALVTSCGTIQLTPSDARALEELLIRWEGNTDPRPASESAEQPLYASPDYDLYF